MRRGVGPAEHLDLGGLGTRRGLGVRRLASGLRGPRLGGVRVDLDRHLRRRELALHVGGAARLLHLDAGVLGLALLVEGRLLLLGDLALGQHLHELLGEHDVLDVDAAGLDVVAGEVAR